MRLGQLKLAATYGLKTIRATSGIESDGKNFPEKMEMTMPPKVQVIYSENGKRMKKGKKKKKKKRVDTRVPDTKISG